MRLIQIVPRLRAYDGVSDYARLLALRLRDSHGVSTTFLSADGSREGGAQGVEVHPLSERSPAAFATALASAKTDETSEVLLHYVGYGYARRGAPLWLARAVSGTRRALNYRLGVIFHELYATGRPWNSSFWLSGVQRVIARRLAREAAWSLATREASRRWLMQDRALGGKSIAVLPMCSTVGEPSGEPSAKTAQLVVWGGRAAKDAIYGEHWHAIRQACRNLEVTQIVDIGAEASTYPRDGVPIERRGALPAEHVSRILSDARFGLLLYPASFLAKSTIYAAFSAHRVVSLLIDGAGTTSLDGPEQGRHFLALSSVVAGKVGNDALRELAQHAHAWYLEHDSAQHAERVRRMLKARP